MFLSRLEKELLSDDLSESTQRSLSAEEWKTLRGLAADETTVKVLLKGADKGCSVVVWDRSEYLHEASRLLQDQNIDVKLTTKMLNSIKTYSPI